ncbi:MAG: hypothetical protein RLZZ584_4420 [Pseudomonadota bacterium]|jgi:hypothetical protein
MSNPHFATLKTPDLHVGPAMFLMNGQRKAFIGAWTFGHPDGLKFPNMPDFEPMSVGDPPHLRQDATHANGLLLTQPIRLHDAFTLARASIIEVEREIGRLYDKGYSQAAAADTLRREVDKMLIELAPHCRNIKAAADACDEQATWARNNFPASTENEVQEAMFDAAIAARLGELSVPEVRMLGEGVIPNRINDTRVVHALHRVPAAALGIDADNLDKIRALYAQVLAPKTFIAIDYLRPMVEAAATVMSSAAVVFARSSGQTPLAIFSSMPEGDYFAGRTTFAGYGHVELRDITRSAAA